MTSIRIVLLSAFVAGVSCVCAAQSKGGVWQMQDSGTTAGLRGIDSVDGTVAWASGTGGTVLRTTDGGAHWQKCATPDADKDGATLDFRGVQAWEAQTAIVMASGPGDKSRLYKTTDGCKTWKLLYMNPDKDGFWDALNVADQSHLMILGDPVNGRFAIFVTEDGGTAWNKAQNKGLESQSNEGAFAASNSSLMVNWVDGPAAFGSGGPSGARFIRECDTCDGAPWIQSQLETFPKGTSAGIFSLNYRDWSRLVAVGGNYTKPNDSTGTAAWSADSGVHWTASTTPPHGYRSAVQWSESLKLWITVGTNGSDISGDDGKTWQPLDEGNWNALSLPFVVGPNGRIARINSAAIPPATAKP
jgi:Photosynthesis system II assembly factor YCF48